MASTARFPLTSPWRSPRRFARLVTSSWRCYAHLRADVRLLGVVMIIIGAIVGTVRCNTAATAWVGVYDSRPKRRIPMIIRLVVLDLVGFAGWILGVYAATAVHPAFGWIVLVGVPAVALGALLLPFARGQRADPAIEHLSRRQRRTPDAVVIGDVGSRGEAPEVGMAAAVTVIRWADREHRILACSASDPEISAKYQRFGFVKIGTKHNRIFGTTDVLVRNPR